jgi:hypothetical protein
MSSTSEPSGGDASARIVVLLTPEAGRWVLAGFLGFGSVLGFIAGASETAGIGQSLLTGLMAFVGGGLLSLVGFVLKNDETPQVRAKATGQALVGLAIGVWLGLGTGIYARLSFDAREDARLAALADAAAKAQVRARAPVTSTPAPAPADVIKSEAEPEKSAATKPGAAPSRPTPAPTTKAEKRPILHADPAFCASLRKLVAARRGGDYYTKLPEAKDEDEKSLKEACSAD